MKTKVKLDHETKSVYHVTVSATDKSSPPVKLPVTILVINVNDEPMFPTDAKVTLQMPENIRVRANIDAPVTATDQDGDSPLTYTKSTDSTDSPDNELFGIRESYGQLYWMGETGHIVDYEGSKSVYQIKVDVNDGVQAVSGDTEGDSIIVLIEVTDINEPPVFVDDDEGDDDDVDDDEMVTRTINENLVARYPVGERILARDPEGKALTYRLSNAPGSTDAASFTLDSDGQLRTRAPLDYETKPTYEVMVSASDGTNTAKTTVTIMVGDVNEKPMFSEGDATVRSVRENSDAATLIGTPIVARDEDMNDILTYAILPYPGTTDDTLFELIHHRTVDSGNR